MYQGVGLAKSKPYRHGITLLTPLSGAQILRVTAPSPF